MASSTLTCWVKHQFFRLESCDRLIMLGISSKGGEVLSDNEREAFSDDAPAEFVGGPGNWKGDAGPWKHALKLTSCSYLQKIQKMSSVMKIW